MKKLTLVMICVWSFIALVIVALIIGGIFVNTRGDLSGGRFSGLFGQPFVERHERASLAVDEAVAASGVDTVKIDLASDRCTIYLTDGDDIEVKHYLEGFDEGRYVRVSEKSGTLTISTRQTVFRSFGLFGFWNSYSLIEVYLPRNYKNALDIDISSGTLDFDGAFELSRLGIKISSGTIRSDYSIKAPDADIQITSGRLRLTGGLESDNYSLRASSGSVDIEGLKGSGNVNVSSGAIRLSGVDIKEWLSAGVTSGTINIGIAGNPGLQFSGHKTSGTIRTYFGSFGNDRNFSGTTGSAPYKQLDVRATSGTIRITQD